MATYLTQKQYSSLNSVFDTSKIHQAEIMDNRDETHNGIVKVWLLSSPYDKSDSSNWLYANYAPMSFGNTPYLEPNVSSESPKSYGTWFPVPDKGNIVLVAFTQVAVNNFELYYFASVPNMGMNQMVPGIGTTQDDLLAATEVNKHNSKQKPQSYKPLKTGLDKQGLTDDYLRGDGTSSSRRESPSRCWGILTPRGSQFVLDDGWTDEELNMPGWFKDKKVNTSKDGKANPAHDGGKRNGELIRIRTRSGTQILLSETYGNIYCVTKDGNTWLELSNDGNIDCYAKESISFRSEGDINHYANGTFNVEAKNIKLKATETTNIESNNINVKANNDITIQSTHDYNLSTGDYYQTSLNYNLTVNNTVFYDIGGDVFNYTIGETVNYYGKDVTNDYIADSYSTYKNGGAKPCHTAVVYPIANPSPTLESTLPDYTSEATANIDKIYTSFPSDTKTIEPLPLQTFEDNKYETTSKEWNETTTDTIVSRIPQHEPFKLHATQERKLPKPNETPTPPVTVANSKDVVKDYPKVIKGSADGVKPAGVYKLVDATQNKPVYTLDTTQTLTTTPVSQLSVANNDEVFKNLTNLKGTGSNTTYTDNGVSKIGVDHTLTADELLTGTVLIGGNIVNFASGGLTTLQTQQLYVQDLTYAQKMIQTQLPGCNFTTNQFSALVSLYSNVGSLSNGSALLNSLKNNSWAEVPTYWKSYTSGNSLAMGVSAAQRLAELGLWNK